MTPMQADLMLIMLAVLREYSAPMEPSRFRRACLFACEPLLAPTTDEGAAEARELEAKPPGRLTISDDQGSAAWRSALLHLRVHGIIRDHDDPAGLSLTLPLQGHEHLDRLTDGGWAGARTRFALRMLEARPETSMVDLGLRIAWRQLELAIKEAE